jgi:hypothetical protein
MPKIGDVNNASGENGDRFGATPQMTQGNVVKPVAPTQENARPLCSSVWRGRSLLLRRRIRMLRVLPGCGRWQPRRLPGLSTWRLIFTAELISWITTDTMRYGRRGSWPADTFKTWRGSSRYERFLQDRLCLEEFIGVL